MSILDRKLPGTPGYQSSRQTTGAPAEPPVRVRSLGDALRRMEAVTGAPGGDMPPVIAPAPVEPAFTAASFDSIHPTTPAPAKPVADPQTMEEWKAFRFPDRPPTVTPVAEPTQEVVKEKEGRGGDGEGGHKPTDPSFYMPLSVGSMAPPQFDETGRGLGGLTAGMVVDKKPTRRVGDLLDLKPAPVAPEGLKTEMQPRTGPRIRR